MIKKMLEDLIRSFHEREVVEKIAKAKGHRLSAYEEEKKAMQQELQKFEETAREMIAIHEMVEDDLGVVIDDPYYRIHPEDSLQICFICKMTKINDDQLLKNYHSLIEALRKVKGELAEPAGKMARFLSNDKDGETGFFTDYKDSETEKFLSKFFD